MSPQKTLDHPSLGPAELVPGIVAHFAVYYLLFRQIEIYYLAAS